MKKLKKHFLCLVLALMPIWFTFGISLFDISFLVPLLKSVITFLSPITEGSFGFLVHPLISITVIYTLMYLAQSEKRTRWERIGFGLAGVVFVAVSTTVYLFVWIHLICRAVNEYCNLL